MSLTQVRYRCAVRHRYGITQLRSCAVVVVVSLCRGPVKLVSAHVSWLCRTCVSDIRSYDHMNNIAWYMLWYSHYDMYVLHDVCDDCLNLITRWVQFYFLRFPVKVGNPSFFLFDDFGKTYLDFDSENRGFSSGFPKVGFPARNSEQNPGMGPKQYSKFYYQ